jgi:hypothetical protein
LWRRLELASGLFLDEVHEILQVAFGWTDSHLHRFSSGPRYHGPETEYYLCPYQVEDWMGKGNREIQTLPVLHLREPPPRWACCVSTAGRCYSRPPAGS